jgi:PBSX family phage terminase large subunit
MISEGLINMGGILQREVLKHQHKIIYSPSRFPCLVAGFGSGKSESLVMKVLKQLFEIPHAQIAVYEPTVDLIKRIMYPRFEEILNDTGLQFKLNKSDGVIDIPSVGRIIFRSLENPSRIIGYEVHHSHVDELDTLEEDKAEEAWMKVLSRNRKRIHNGTMNTVSAYTTPEGFRFTYKRWHKQRLEDIKKKGRSDYELIKGSTYDNPFLDPSYVENLESSYPKELINAYLKGEFVNLESGVVYSDFDADKNHVDRELPNSNEVLHIGMDFNVNHMSAVVCIKDKDKLFVLEEISDMVDTPSMIAEIKKRYDGRQIYVYPDASGNSRKTVDASKSDIGLLREAGFKVSAPKKNPPVKDRIITVNTMFCNARDERRLFINTYNCSALTDNLNQQAYDKYGQPIKANNVDHMLDALGYVVYRLFGISRGKSRISRMRF